MVVFRVVARCTLVKVHRRFRGAFCLDNQALIVLMMEAGSISETSVNCNRLYAATTQKTIIFILAAVRT
jgi:hypothetical protein